MKISLPEKIDAKLGESITALVIEVIEPVNQFLESDEKVLEIDVSPCQFITPLIATPLAVLHNRFKGTDKLILVTCNDASAFSKYAKVVYFPDGLTPEAFESRNYGEILDYYVKKNYIPIFNFPAKLDSLSIELREGILQSIHNLLKQQLKVATRFETGVAYLIDELVSNIKDHSEADRGFIFAQFYPGSKYLDVCIADAGIGIFGSYRKNGNQEIQTHSMAVNAAVKGLSTKNSDSRGFGISTSIKMLVNGMGGSFILMSGNANLVNNPQRTDVNEFPKSMSWQGTLVGLRIPFTENKFDYINYLE